MSQGANVAATQGPKKVDQNMYKELAEKQTAKAQMQIQSQANTFGTSLIPSAKTQESQGIGQKDANFNQKFGGG